MEVGQLWVKLGLDKKNFDKGIEESKQETEGLDKAIKNGLSESIVKLTGEIQRLIIPTKNQADQEKNLQAAIGKTDDKLKLLKAQYDSIVTAKGKESKAALSALKAIESESTSLEKMKQKLSEAKNETNNLANSSGKLSSFLKTAFSFAVGQGIFDLFKAGLKSAWDMAIGFNSSMQQNSIALETMLGSADKAGAMLNDLADMAANTPFELPQLTDATKKLMAFGFSASQVKPMLKSIGDAAAGLGMGAEGVDRITIALGQMRAKGKVTAQEMMQMTEAGIPAWELLASAMGKSTAEVMDLSEKGLIPADIAIRQLIDGMEKKFPNMMDKQSKSLAGLMSTWKDNVQMTLAGVLKPGFEYLTNNILPKAIEMTKRLQEAYRMGGLKGVLKEIFPPEVAGIIITTGEAIKAVFGFMSKHGEAVKSVVITLTAAFLAYKGVVIATTIAQELYNAVAVLSAYRTGGLAAAQTVLASATGSATAAQYGLNAAISSNPIGFAVAAVVALTFAFKGLGKMIDDTEGKTKAMTETLIKGIRDRKEAEVKALDDEYKAQTDTLNKKRDASDSEHQAAIDRINDEYGVYQSTNKSKTDSLRNESEKRKQILDEEYNAQIELLNAQSNNRIKGYEDQIKAIDAKTKKEDDADRLAKDQQRIRDIEAQMTKAKSYEELVRLQQEKADLESGIERRKILDQREAEKEAIRQKIDDERENAKKQTDVLRERLEKEKALIDQSTDSRIAKVQQERESVIAAENAKYAKVKDSLAQEENAISESYNNRKKIIDNYYDELEKETQEKQDQWSKFDSAMNWGQALTGLSGLASKYLLKKTGTYDKMKQAQKDGLSPTDVLQKRLNNAWNDILSGIGDVTGYASGTGSATAGIHEVAEDGFEIVLGRQARKFKGGEQVLNHSESIKALSGNNVEQHFHIDKFIVESKGDERRTLQQLQFLAQF